MLKQRVLTAIILILLTLAALFFLSPRSFCLLTGIIMLGAAWEWSSLMQIKKTVWRLSYLILMAILILGALLIPASLIFFCATAWWLLAILLVMVYPYAIGWGKSVVWRGLMGILVLLPCWAAINFIRNENDGIYSLLFLFVLIWGADSAAYFVGKKWGKHRLAPQISPGKSWEGLIGGLFFSLLIVLLALWMGHVPRQAWGRGILLSLVAVLFSVVGDLVESMLKRQASLKDSGQLLPGHGGLLDRIDSLTAAAPIFVLGSMLF